MGLVDTRQANNCAAQEGVPQWRGRLLSPRCEQRLATRPENSSSQPVPPQGRTCPSDVQLHISNPFERPRSDISRRVIFLARGPGDESC